MILDSIKNIDRYKGDKKLYGALQYMASVTEENFPTEKVFADDDSKLFFIPQKYETKPAKDCPFEGHELRADIHYILKGREGIQFTPLAKMKGIGVFGADEPDYGEFEGEADGQIYLDEGYFAVLYPGEAHKVSIMDGQPQPVVKLLAKMEV